MTDAGEVRQLVVVGSSAGGIDALSELVRTLPADFPAPILVAQHLDPNRVSHLKEILSPRSTLPVRIVTDRTPLEQGVVFVVPANRHVEINDHSISLIEGQGRPKPSIDLLLTTSAAIFGEGLYAVILTGLGSDGTAGARDVKAAGGTVIIQNPDTAKFDSMPRSLAPTSVDIVANLESIGSVLHDLLTGAYVVTPEDWDQQLNAFLQQLRDRSGIDFSTYKASTIRRRLQHRMAAVGVTSLDAYVRHLRRHPSEYQKLVATFLIKVTEFFRDRALFDELRDRILPSLIEEGRARRELRLWSAGCATGEEAYSLAILVAELLGDDLEQMTVRIFATDLDAGAVAFARRGVYPAATLENLPPELVDRHFTMTDGAYEVSKRTRGLVVFGQHDLAQRAPFPRIDLTLCRNVLIYFTPELQRRALHLFAFALRDRGCLVLGKAETVGPLSDSFALTDPVLKIYERIGDRVLIPPARISSSPLTVSRREHNAPISLDVVRSAQQETISRTRSGGEAPEGLLVRFPMGVVVVDRRYDIQFINTAARRLFGIHTTAVGQDFIHLVQNASLLPLRTAIDLAFRGESPSGIYPVATAETVMGEARHLEVTCYPERLEGLDGHPDAVMIVVVDASERVQERTSLEQTVRRAQADAEEMRSRIDRLTVTNAHLLSSNEQLANANAELLSGNEELLVANEEIQAATEEVETLNEELQATNEELETLNEELQATVEELNTTNDDLQARSLEMQELAVTLEAQRQVSEAERTRLSVVLGSIDDAVLVVDRLGQTVLANEAYERMFGGTESDPRFEKEQGHPLPPEAAPRRRAGRGEKFSEELSYLGSDGTRHWIEANGTPIRSEGGEERGVVVIRDITDRSLRRLQDQFLAVASHELRTPLTALQGALQLLERQLRPLPDGERLRRHAGQAMRQVHRLTTHINELMDVARLQSGQLTLKRERLDLAPLIERAVETARLIDPTKTVNLTAPAEQVWTEADPGRVEQVLLNLIGNAFVHAPSSERIDIRLTAGEEDAEIQVQDYGEGIQPQQKESIFSRFSSLDRLDRGRSGLGLGLFIAREIVTAHGGTIDVASTPGEGTTFTVCLPLAPAPGAD